MPVSAEYLTKYLSASGSKSSGTNPDYDDSSSRPKKRRKKDKHADTSTLLIADDDADLLLSSKKNQLRNDEDEDGPLLYDTKARSAEFRKKKSSAWQIVQDGEQSVATLSANGAQATKDKDPNADEADAILAAAAAASDKRREEIDAEDAPAIVEMTGDVKDDVSAPRMSSGVRAGLQTAADTAAIMAAEETREREEQRNAKKKKRQKDESAVIPEEETIYRDATGRRIDISMRRAEARKEELARQAAERKERESAMGEVQLREREQAKQDLEEAKFLSVGRDADDEEMNEKLKEELRWDDPMAQYMAERNAEKEAEAAVKRGGRKGGHESSATGVVKAKRKEYAGAAPPNRYGIKPGWRWDGVDRGNGFEKEWFQARGRKTRNENLEYQWAMDE